MSLIKVSIPEPCHESWDHMLPNALGRYCGVCEKTVTDFTGQSNQQIKDFMEQHAAEKICGRFRSENVYTVKTEPPAIKTSWWSTKWMAFVAALAVMGWSKKSVACPLPTGFKPGDENKKITAKKGQTVIHGWVKNLKGKKGISQVQIRIYSGGKEIAFSTNFTNGSYFITLPENTIWDHLVTLEYNHVNYEARVFENVPVNKDRMKLDVAMVAIQTGTAALANSKLVPFERPYALGGVAAYHYKAFEAPDMPIPPKSNIIVMGGPRDVIIENTKDEITDPGPGTIGETSTNSQDFSVKTYPNPGNGIFHVGMQNSTAARLMVYDLHGKLILHKKMNASEEQVDITAQPNGTYLVVVIDELTGIKKQNKIIKTN